MYFGWQPYVPVAERRRKAERKAAQLRKKGQPIAPVTIEGLTIAKSFWGKSWCTNLERYSDYASRLPRGRTYVRNGSVVDLQIAKGEVTALVAGSELYKIGITIAPVKPAAWKSICRDCAGTVSSLVELLQGRLAKSVMDRVCREGDGLFPAPREIKLSCSCPDWASMCKHVAAALYGVGARLDSRPELLFVLRGVDQNELLSAAGPEMALNAAAPAAGKLLDDSDVAALFGLEMAEAAGSEAAGPEAGSRTVIPVVTSKPTRSGRSRVAKASASVMRGGKGAALPVKTKQPVADRPARTKGKAETASSTSGPKQKRVTGRRRPTGLAPLEKPHRESARSGLRPPRQPRRVFLLTNVLCLFYRKLMLLAAPANRRSFHSSGARAHAHPRLRRSGFLIQSRPHPLPR